MAFRTQRRKIVEALAAEVIKIDGTGDYLTDLFTNVDTRLKFFDEVSDFPTVSIVAGQEQREYLPSGFAWAFLNITIRCYVNAENSEEELEKVLSDIEYVLDKNQDIEYDTGKSTEEILVLSITTDEGVLNPIGVGEISVLVRYDLNR